MAYPFLHYENWSTGTKGEFDGTTVDTGGAISFPHYRNLIAQDPSQPITPWGGAYAMKVDLASVSTTAYVLENPNMDATSTTTRYLAFPLFVTTDLTMAASDRFTVANFRSAGADEAVIDIRNNSGQIEILASETGASATVRNGDLTLGEWHWVEMTATHDGDSGGDGSIDFFLDGNQIGSQIGTLTQAAITNFRLGCQGIDAGTTAGRLYFGPVIYDDARIYPMKRFQNNREFFGRQSVSTTVATGDWLFLGPGHMELMSSYSTGNDEVVKVFDTDGTDDTFHATNFTINRSDPVLELTGSQIESYAGFTRFEKGCYIEITGTNPRIRARWAEQSEKPGIYGPQTLSDAGIRNWAQR